MKKFAENIIYSPVEFKYNLPCFFHDEEITDEIASKNWHGEIEFFYAKTVTERLYAIQKTFRFRRGNSALLTLLQFTMQKALLKWDFIT